jgi:hypothetical protein
MSAAKLAVSSGVRSDGREFNGKGHDFIVHPLEAAVAAEVQ